MSGDEKNRFSAAGLTWAAFCEYTAVDALYMFFNKAAETGVAEKAAEGVVGVAFTVLAALAIDASVPKKKIETQQIDYPEE